MSFYLGSVNGFFINISYQETQVRNFQNEILVSEQHLIEASHHFQAFTIPVIYTPNYPFMLEQLRVREIELQTAKINFLIETHDNEFFYENVEYTARDYDVSWERITSIFNQHFGIHTTKESLQQSFFDDVLNGDQVLNYHSLTLNKRWSDEHIRLLQEIVTESNLDLNSTETWKQVSITFSIRSGCERSAKQCKRKILLLMSENSEY